MRAPAESVMKVLLVEDDALLGDGVATGARQAGDEVEWARDGLAALKALGNGTFDVMVLDLGLPGISGLDVLSRMRKQGNALPVLVLTARDGVEDRVKGLDRGADDYLTKPFELSELLARMRALVRRARGQVGAVLVAGDVTLDPASRRVTRAGNMVELSPREFAVLKELMENADRVLSRERLERCLYGWHEDVSSNAVEVHVHHLRKKVGEQLVKTVRGVGYMIVRAG
jgi:DNA-binding response OmpR family regulator